MIWRGPMLHNALTQFLRDTRLGRARLPGYRHAAGHGRRGHLAFAAAAVEPAAVVVCTPQDVALLDAVKAIAMFRKVHIDVVGMVENMSFFVCPNCQARHEIFGSGGAQRRAAEWTCPFSARSRSTRRCA